MAYIRDIAVTEYTSASASWVPEMPVHEPGDLLLAFLAKDATAAFTAHTGWTTITQQASAGAYGRSIRRTAASSSESLTVTLSSTTGVAVVVSVADVMSGSEINASAVSTSDDASVPYATPALTTTGGPCLVFFFLAGDGGIAPTAAAPAVNLYNGDAANGSLGLAYTYKQTPGAVIQPNFFGRANDDTRTHVIAVRSAAGAKVPPYADPDVTVLQTLRMLPGPATTQSDTWPTSGPVPLAIGQDCAVAFSYEALTTSYTDVTASANTATNTFAIGRLIDDILYIGSNNVIDSMAFLTGVPATVGAVIWEIWNGTTWIASGGAYAYTGGGGAFAVSNAAKAAQRRTTVNGSASLYFIRGRITTGITATTTLTHVRVNGAIRTQQAGGASADDGFNPYMDALSVAYASASSTIFAGPTLTLSSTWGWNQIDPGIVLIGHKSTTPREYAVDMAMAYPPGYASAGAQVTFIDTSNRAVSYVVAARGAKDVAEVGYNVAAFSPAFGGIPWGGIDMATFSMSAIKSIGFTTKGIIGSVSITWAMIMFGAVIGIAGGTAAAPLSFDDIVFVLNRSAAMMPLCAVSGSAGLMRLPLQFGGGSPVFTEVKYATFQFPHAYDGVDYFSWNVPEYEAGVHFAPSSTDVLHFKSCSFTSESPYHWTWDADTDPGTDIDFSGTAVVNAGVELAPITYENMVFRYCPTFNQNGATLVHCAVQDTTVSSDSLADMALIENCSFTSSGIGHAIEVAVDNLVSNSTFDSATGWSLQTGHTVTGGVLQVDVAAYINADTTVSVVAGHKYAAVFEITAYTSGSIRPQLVGGTNVLGDWRSSVGTHVSTLTAETGNITFRLQGGGSGAVLSVDNVRLYDVTDLNFAGNKFHGYAADDGDTGNEAIFIDAGELVPITINITGGGDTPSIRTAGATVVVNNAVILTLTGLVSGSDIVVLSAGTATERVNVDANPATTYAFSYAYVAGDYVDICVYKAGYVPTFVRGFLLTNEDSTLPVTQVLDRNYLD